MSGDPTDRLRRAVRWFRGGAPPEDPAPGLQAHDVALDAFMLLQRVEIGVSFCVLDLRPLDERRDTGTIEGALTGVQPASFAYDEGLPTVVVASDDQTALDAALTLRRRGHPDAWGVVGGMRAWCREGGETVPA